MQGLWRQVEVCSGQAKSPHSLHKGQEHQAMQQVLHSGGAAWSSSLHRRLQSRRERTEAELDPFLDPKKCAQANAVQEFAQQPTPQQPRTCKPMQAQQPLPLLPQRSVQRQLRLPEMRHARAE